VRPPAGATSTHPAQPDGDDPVGETGGALIERRLVELPLLLPDVGPLVDRDDVADVG